MPTISMFYSAGLVVGGKERGISARGSGVARKGLFDQESAYPSPKGQSPYRYNKAAEEGALD